MRHSMIPENLRGYCRDHFITPLNSSPLHAHLNGLAEAAVKSVKYLLIKSDTFADFKSQLYKMQAVPSSRKTNCFTNVAFKQNCRRWPTFTTH
jgi:hypothetical protein